MLAQLENKQAQVEAVKLNKMDFEMIKELLVKFNDVYWAASKELRKRLVQSLVKEVKLGYDENGKVIPVSMTLNFTGEQIELMKENKEIFGLKDSSSEIYFHGGRVASHVRLKKAQRDAVMVPGHMPEAHRKYLAYNKDAFLSWAETAGASVSKVVSQFLGSGKEPEQGYKYCVSLMKAADRYGQDRVNAACERALAFSNAPTLRSILAILKNGQDKIPLHKT